MITHAAHKKSHTRSNVNTHHIRTYPVNVFLVLSPLTNKLKSRTSKKNKTNKTKSKIPNVAIASVGIDQFDRYTSIVIFEKKFPRIFVLVLPFKGAIINYSVV